MQPLLREQRLNSVFIVIGSGLYSGPFAPEIIDQLLHELPFHVRLIHTYSIVPLPPLGNDVLVIKAGSKGEQPEPPPAIAPGEVTLQQAGPETVALALAVAPEPSVTVTEYVPGQTFDKLEVVAPFDHA